MWANKKGTQVDETGRLCVAANYFPAWTGEKCTYQVLGKWAETLWQQYKLETTLYEEYLYKSRDGVTSRIKNLDLCREHDVETEEQAVIEANTKRIRSNPSIYTPPETPRVVQDWLSLFAADRLRYPVLIIRGPSFSGKTERAKSFFWRPLELKIGPLTHFPNTMRDFDRRKHDGIILDDIRDLTFLADQQDKLQGKYDARIEFATTPGGQCAYKKYLFAIPIVATINYSTANMGLLERHDWLGNGGNRVVVDFDGAQFS